MSKGLARIIARRAGAQASVHPSYNPCTTVQRCEFFASQSEKTETDLEHEAKAAAEHASFFSSGVSTTKEAIRKKMRSAVGLDNGKEISENETMEPAGHMQARDPKASADDVYKDLKSKTSGKWDEAGHGRPPNQHYPGHGQNS